METSETSKNWKTGSCFDLESYACKIPAGRSIHPAPKPTGKISNLTRPIDLPPHKPVAQKIADQTHR